MLTHPNTIAILGIDDHGKVAAEIAEQNGYQVFFFDNKYPQIKQCGHWDVVGNEDDLKAHGSSYDAIFVALSHNKLRKLKLNELKNLGFRSTALISPYAIISEYAEINDAVLIVANSTINYGVKIGEGCIINTGATIDHGCVIDPYVHVSPGVNIAAEVRVGEFSWVGIGSTLTHHIKVSHTVIVGAGAVVLNDIPPEVTVVGCPAHIVRRK